MFRLFVCLICLSLPWLAQAKLYKIIDDDDGITYTDTPPYMDTKEHKLRTINAISNPLFNINKLNNTIPYIEEGGAMIVRGSVNGISMRFIVDTSTTLLAIPPRIAKQAGLLNLPFTLIETQTENGIIEVKKVVIRSLNIARVKQSQIAATIHSISKNNPNLGLLGMNFFHHYKMTIDHKKQNILLENK